jgi:hypothetical protein
VTLSTEQPLVDDLHLYINDRGRVALRPNEPMVEESILSVFPNPVENTMTISGLQVDESCNLTVSDVLGNVLIMVPEVKANLLGECQMQVGELSRGVYFLTVTGASGSRVLKIVKK